MKRAEAGPLPFLISGGVSCYCSERGSIIPEEEAFDLPTALIFSPAMTEREVRIVVT